MEMRRIDAARIIREAPEGVAWFVREDRRSYGTATPIESGTFRSQMGDELTVACERVDGGYVWKGRRWPFRVTRTYPRLRVEWGRVDDALFYDSEWVPFSPEVPANLWGE